MSYQISSKIEVDIPDSVLEEIERVARASIVRHIEEHLVNAEEEVREIVKETLEESTVIQGLRGDLADTKADLQASFGLTDDMAQEACEQIIETVSEAVTIRKQNIKVVKHRHGFSITLTVSGLNTNEIKRKLKISSFPFTYKSISKHNRVHLIPWMKWVLDGSEADITSTTPSIVNYYISTPPKAEESRSGRAFMFRNVNTTNPYSLPSVIIPRGKAKNFIEEIYNSREFRSRVTSAVTDSLISGLE